MNPTAQILIVLHEDGKVVVQFSGPQNKALLLGLLELAKPAILNPQESSGPPILLARGGLPDGMKN